MLSTAKTSVAF